MWINLSPDIMQGNLGAGKADAARVVHMAFELAKKSQPAIIFIDEIDRVFSSKKKSTDDAARLKKDLISHRAQLEPEDRVLILGNTNKPIDILFRASSRSSRLVDFDNHSLNPLIRDGVDTGELLSFFSPSSQGRAFFTPYPDYGTRVLLWSTFIERAVRC